MKMLQVQYHQMFVAELIADIGILKLPFYRRWPIQLWADFKVYCVKAWLLIAWRVTNEELGGGWVGKWYQCFAMQEPDKTGFIFVFWPFHYAVRFWVHYAHRRQERRESGKKRKEEEGNNPTKGGNEEPTEETVDIGPHGPETVGE